MTAEWITPEDFAAEYSMDVADAREAVAELLRHGLIETDGDRFRITPSGLAEGRRLKADAHRAQHRQGRHRRGRTA